MLIKELSLLIANLSPMQYSFSQITIAYLLIDEEPLLYLLYLHLHLNYTTSKIRMWSYSSLPTPPLIDLFPEILKMIHHQTVTHAHRIAVSTLHSEFDCHLSHFSQRFQASIEFGAKVNLLNN